MRCFQTGNHQTEGGNRLAKGSGHFVLGQARQGSSWRLRERGDTLLRVPDYFLEWQRLLDPARFNKKDGAKYHTAASVVLPGSAEIPEGAPKGSVTILFYVPRADWVSEPQKVELVRPTVVEKKPRGRAKSGSVVIMDATTVYVVIGPRENFYQSARLLATHETVRVGLRPGRVRKPGDEPETVIVGTFLPSAGEPGFEIVEKN